MMVKDENEMLLKDFLESHWTQWLQHCRENGLAEEEAESICAELTQ